MKTVREVLQRSGVDMAALLERQEVITACQQQLDKLPRPVGMTFIHVTVLQGLCHTVTRANRVNFEHCQEAVSCMSNTSLLP